MISRNVQRVFVLLSCTFLGLICGTLYLYSSYSPQLANQLHYSASDSSIIALCGTIGVAIAGPISGAGVDRKGYTVSLLIGGILIISSYIGLKRQFDYAWSNVQFSSFTIFLVGVGSTFINSACLKCCAVSFPSIRGVATSLPLALYGLSALFYSVIASVFYPGDTSNFLGFLVMSIIFIYLICFPSVYIADCEHKLKSASTFHKPSVTVNSTHHHPSNTDSQSISSLFTDVKFWLLFLITGTLAAMGQMYIYSVGYMVKALVTKALPAEMNVNIIIQQDQQFQVGLISIANFIGRIVSGISGDIITQSFHKPRESLLFIPAIGMGICQLLAFNIESYTELPSNSFLIGFFYGFTFCILPIIVGDAFGMENFSFNWGIVSMSPIVPSFYFTKLFGQIYDSNSVTIQDLNDANSNTFVCTLGKLCYNSIFKLTLALSISAIIAVVVLNFREFISKRRKITSLPLASPTQGIVNEKVN